MDIYVACDVCGHRYIYPKERLGSQAKCKSCSTSFDVSSENYYDPQTSESTTAETDEDDSKSGVSITIYGLLTHGLTAAVTISLLTWMSSLFVRSPQSVVAALRELKPAEGINAQAPSQGRQVAPGKPARPRAQFQNPLIPSQPNNPLQTIPDVPPPFTPPLNNPYAGGPSIPPPVIQRQQMQPPNVPRVQPPPLPNRPFGRPPMNGPINGPKGP